MMTTTDKKTRLEKTIADATPLYAAVGAGDLAVEKIRSARLKFDASSLRDAQAKALARVSAAQADFKAAPQQVKDLPDRLQAVLGDAVTTAVANTINTYGELAGRGRNLVTRVRGQEATQELEQQLKSTVSRTKAATTTAKKSASATKSSTKGAVTSARKTAGAAKNATEATVDKVGN